MIGRTLSHYQITEKLGAGGMGEVYLAHDTRLGRDVAIKVLAEGVARDPERIARFQREARTLAQLNHPNIAAIYDFEQVDGVPFLVLEYVPGPTLAEQIAQGPLAVETALQICSEVGQAVEAAHEKDIVHRDLKPANIKITPEGKVKVLDFGLARALSDDVAGGDPSRSPTMSMGATRAGVILGTAAYMSPEQARGRPLDKRTDIWAFGCVVYEMLTGRPVFAGDTITDIFAAIVGREPDWAALPAATPHGVKRLLHRCLEKDAGRRLRDISDGRMLLEEWSGSPEVSAVSAATGAAAAVPRRAPWSLAAALGAGTIIAGIAVWFLKPPLPAPPRFPKRLTMEIPPASRTDFGSNVVLSPDGRRLAYIAVREGQRQLFLRSMDQLEPTLVRGSGTAGGPFFSPDGQWVAFFAAGSLRKVSVTGGAPQTICNIAGRGGSWGPDNTIIFSAGAAGALMKVPAAGGTPQPLTTLDPAKKERAHLWPEILPGAKAVLFSIVSASFDDARIVAQRLESGERSILVEGGTHPHYSPTGHLVYGRAGGLVAVPFDLERLQVTGTPVPVVEGVAFNATSGAVQASFSGDGSLVYIGGGGEAAAKLALLWVDRKGVSRPATETRAAFHDPRFSPDGKRLAVNVTSDHNDLWVLDTARDTLTRLTFEGDNHWHAWTPDGKRLAYGSTRAGGAYNLFWKPADGSRADERLATNDQQQMATSFSPDGRALAFTQGGDIWILPLEGDRKPRPFLQTQFQEGNAHFSPDGRWLAYESVETGRKEVYVQPYPGPGGKWQISTEGGFEPLWARSGRELFYRSGNKVMVVAVETGAPFTVSKPKMLFEGRYVLSPGFYPYWDIHPDGQRFAMIQAPEETGAAATITVHVVLDWFEDLKRRVPVGKK